MATKSKLSKKKVISTVIALVAVALVFSLLPSCGKKKSESEELTGGTIVAVPHDKRDAHFKTFEPDSIPSGIVSEDPEHVDDISFKLNFSHENYLPESVEVMLLYSRAKENSKKEEVTIQGDFEPNNEGGLEAKLEGNKLVRGDVECKTTQCKGIISFKISYSTDDSERLVKTVIRSGVRNTLDAEVIVGSIHHVVPEFANYWGDYLANLRDNEGILVKGDTSENLITSSTISEDKTFISVSSAVAARENIFATPANMRSSHTVVKDGATTRIDGILINGETLVNDPTKCVEWGGNFNKENRYASAMLNAVLSFVGSGLKNGSSCATLYLGEASKVNGGKIESKTYYQNGLDVDISYIKGKDLFVEMDSDETELILTDDEKHWNLVALKRFHDTGVVNRFVTLPKVKSALVKYAKDTDILDTYKPALEKIYPEEGFSNHYFRLEIGCSSDQFGDHTIGDENKWCIDSPERSKTWSVDWCDDSSCQATKPAPQDSNEDASDTEVGSN